MKLWDAFMIGAVVAGTALLVTVPPSAAQDRIEVPLPDISALDDEAAAELARRIGEADVITSNCTAHEISGGEWTLLAGTGDLLAEKLQMEPAEYDRNFNAPAYSLLDDPEACDRIGPQVAPLIEELVAMGGATEPDLPEPDPADPDQAATVDQPDGGAEEGSAETEAD